MSTKPLSILSLALVCSCNYPEVELIVKPESPPADVSAFSPAIKGKPRRVMVLPPPDSQADVAPVPKVEEGAPPEGERPACPDLRSDDRRGHFNAGLGLLERAVLNQGFTLVALETTTRVAEGRSEKGAEAGGVSNLEAALLYARQAGADSILQIDTFAWTTTPVPDRFFAFSNGSVREVALADYAAATGPKYALSSEHLYIAARLIDVETGEILASLKGSGNADQNLPSDYHVVLQLQDGRIVPVYESPGALHGLDWAAARRRTEAVVVYRIVKKIADRAHSTGEGDSE